MFCLQSERKNLGSDTGSKRLGGGATMKLNTIETGRKRLLACIGTFLIGLGLFMESDGTAPMVIGLIVTTLYAVDKYLEVRE